MTAGEQTSINTRTLALRLFKDLDPAAWDQRVREMAPELRRTLMEPQDYLKDGLECLAATLWFMSPTTPALKELLVGLGPVRREDLRKILLEREGPVDLELLRRDVRAAFVKRLGYLVKAKTYAELRLLITETVAVYLYQDNRQPSFDAPYYDLLMEALATGDPGVVDSVAHRVFRNGRLAHEMSAEELARLAGVLPQFLKVDTRYALSIVRASRECKTKSAELLAALSGDEPYVRAARMLYAEDVGLAELVRGFIDDAPIIRAVCGLLTGQVCDKPSDDVHARLREAAEKFPGSAGPYAEQMKKKASLKAFLAEIAALEPADVPTFDLHEFWWDLPLPTTATALAHAPEPTTVDPQSLPDPTRTTGGEEDIGSELYTGDASEQHTLATMILTERFPDVPFVALCHFQRRDENYDADRRLFGDSRAEGRNPRPLYEVAFESRPTGWSRVTLTWQDVLELQEDGSGARYFVDLPHPLPYLAGLEAARVRIAERESDTLLTRPADAELTPFVMGATPDRSLGWRATWLAFRLDDVWHEALPNRAMILWRDFLRAYGLQQQDDWVSSFNYDLGYVGKRKLVVDAIKAPDLVPSGLLAMLGVGPLEDVLCDEVMDDLEALERETKDPVIRARLCETIAGIYVHGDPKPIQVRWMALVERVAPEDVLAGLRPYFASLRTS